MITYIYLYPNQNVCFKTVRCWMDRAKYPGQYLLLRLLYKNHAHPGVIRSLYIMFWCKSYKLERLASSSTAGLTSQRLLLKNQDIAVGVARCKASRARSHIERVVGCPFLGLGTLLRISRAKVWMNSLTDLKSSMNVNFSSFWLCAIYGKHQLEISRKSEKTKIELRVRRYGADFVDQNKKN